MCALYVKGGAGTPGTEMSLAGLTTLEMTDVHTEGAFRVSHVCPDENNAWERMLKRKVGCPHGRAPDLPTFAIASVQMAA